MALSRLLPIRFVHQQTTLAKKHLCRKRNYIVSHLIIWPTPHEGEHVKNLFFLMFRLQLYVVICALPRPAQVLVHVTHCHHRTVTDMRVSFYLTSRSPSQGSYAVLKHGKNFCKFPVGKSLEKNFFGLLVWKNNITFKT